MVLQWTSLMPNMPWFKGDWRIRCDVSSEHSIDRKPLHWKLSMFLQLRKLKSQYRLSWLLWPIIFHQLICWAFQQAIGPQFWSTHSSFLHIDLLGVWSIQKRLWVHLTTLLEPKRQPLIPLVLLPTVQVFWLCMPSIRRVLNFRRPNGFHPWHMVSSQGLLCWGVVVQLPQTILLVCNISFLSMVIQGIQDNISLK